ncbi:MAG: hypothetical protein R2710_12120 [Acidimicrobiales bacterium]
MTAEQIREATPDNRMVGFPYTKAMNSNWDLDQGTSIILCSVAAAEAAAVPRDRWVFPLAGTDGHDTYAVSERRDLHSSPPSPPAAAGSANSPASTRPTPTTSTSTPASLRRCRSAPPNSAWVSTETSPSPAVCRSPVAR